MSRENVDKRAQAEALISAVNRRDFDAVAEMPTHPDLEFHSAMAAIEGEAYFGLEGIRKWAQDMDAAFEDFSTELVDFRELSGERAVMVIKVKGRSRASRIPLEVHMGQIWTWRDGLMWRNQVYSDVREALEAAGLSE